MRTVAPAPTREAPAKTAARPPPAIRPAHGRSDETGFLVADFSAVPAHAAARRGESSEGVQSLPRYPHANAIARAFRLADFEAVALVDPSVARLGAEAAAHRGTVRFARWPSLEVATHEAAHVMQERRGGRRASAAAAENQAAAIAGRVVRGLGAADLVAPGALVFAGDEEPRLFVPAGSPPATHTILPGETIGGIARDVYGSRRYAVAIQNANPGTVTVSRAGTIYAPPGTVLNLPDRPDAADPWVNPYVTPLLLHGGAWTQAQAEATLTAFAAEPAARRDAMVARYGPPGNLPVMLRGLPANSTQPGGAFETQARDLLQRIQRSGALAEGAVVGLPSERRMAQAQANMMIARNRASAAATLPRGSAPPSPAQVAAQQQAQAQQGSVGRQVAVMTPAQETAINNTLITTSIPTFITWATANRPSLRLTAANLRADARAVFDLGEGIVAFADRAAPRAVVGDAFMQMVAANPAYALPTVIHEALGHNTFEGVGRFGTPGASHGLDLYDRAAALMPGYRRPTGDDRRDELFNYGLHESEMYALMREIPYFTPNAPAHAAALGNFNYAPGPAIQGRIQLIANGFEARVAQAMLRGLYLRFLADPTIGGPAMNAFRQGVRNVFPGPAGTSILR